MKYSSEVEQAIGEYLKQVADAMADAPADEKDGVLREVEAHVYAALEESGQSAGPREVEAVLAGMALPASYGAAQLGTACTQAGTNVPGRKLSGHAVIAAVLGLFFLLCFPAFLGLFRPRVVPAAEYAPSVGTGFLAKVVLTPLGLIVLIVPFAATVLGWVAVHRIRSSGGRLYGLLLAVVMGLFYPLLASDALIVHVMRSIPYELAARRHAANAAAWVAVIVVLVVDALIVRAAWRWAAGSARTPRDVPSARPRLCWMPVVGGALMILTVVAVAGLVSYGMSRYRFHESPKALALGAMERRAEGRRASAPGDEVDTVWSMLHTDPYGRLLSELWLPAVCVVVILPLIVTGLGLAGISVIRSSHGTLTGLPLAVAVSLLCPLLLADSVVAYCFFAVAYILGRNDMLLLALAMLLAGLAAVVALDFFLIRRAWRWATTPMREGELT